MHQTFYIDIDEEITSIIERLKKARAREIIIVVPKRALLIQSIVNLRILKKEADEMGIQLMVVTQDKLGKILIEKTGILVQQKMDDLPEEEINLNKDVSDFNKNYRETKIKTAGVKKRLDKIGSENYFDEEKLENNTADKINIAKERIVSQKQLGKKEKIINKELVTNLKKNIAKKNNDDKDDDKIEKFFYSSKNSKEQKKYKKNDYGNYNISKKVHWWFLSFGAIGLSVVVAVLAYLFIPKATVIITTKVKARSVDSKILGKTSANSIDFSQGIIPAKIITVNPEITKSYKTTGHKIVSNQKARGTVTIYNEYSSSPQPLVATTRFISSDGKLFRLLRKVIVPGETIVNGQMKAGSVKAEVEADESGKEFNIGPDKFTIPGFKNRPNKYKKFYAKSEQSMSGGGNGNEKVGVVVQADIDKAKRDALAELNKSVKQKIKEVAGGDIVLLDDAINKNEAVYKLSNSLDEVADSFQITVSMKVEALIVNQSDFTKVVAQMLAVSSGGQVNINNRSIKIDFGKADADFNSGVITIRFHAVGNVKPDIDLTRIKKDILGKSETDLKSYLSAYPDIKKINIEYHPSFINGRIPFQANRVKMILDN